MAGAQKAGKKELLWRIFNGQMEEEVTAKASKNKQPKKEIERDGLKAKSLNLITLAIKISWGIRWETGGFLETIGHPVYPTGKF